MNTPGYNPMRWDCEESGCYNTFRRPKIEVFAQCFPGRIAMSDIDGITEVNSHFLLLEWKDGSAKGIPTGQRIMFERMTVGGRFTVAVVAGNAETMEVSRLAWFCKGEYSEVGVCTLEHVQRRFKDWATWAREQSA